MKFMRVLGGLLFGLGCVAALIGLLALLLPMVDNDQLRLVLKSFETPSDNAIVNAINTVMTYALRNCYIVMLMGAGTLLFGAVLMLFGKGSKAKNVEQSEAAPYTVAHEDADTSDIPVWKQGDKPEERPNPYADASVADMLTPNASAAVTGSTTNPFAPRNAGDKGSPAYLNPSSDAYAPDRKNRKAHKDEHTASDAGNADHLFDLIRRYGADKDNGGEGGITVSLTSPGHTDEATAQIHVVMDTNDAPPDAPREGYSPDASTTPSDTEREPEPPAPRADAPAAGNAPREAYIPSADNAPRESDAPSGAERRATTPEPHADTPEAGYAAREAYIPPEASHTPREAYAPPEAYAPRDYERRPVYTEPRADAREAGYAPREAYAPRDAYAPPEAYARREAYAPRDSGYAPRGAYAPPDAYARREAYAPRDYERRPVYPEPRYGAPEAGYAPREHERRAVYSRPRPDIPREGYAPRRAPRHSMPGERMRIHGYDVKRPSEGGAMHVLHSIAPSATQKPEETIYRAPSYKPQDTGGRPRIRSTFPTDREDDRTGAPREDNAPVVKPDDTRRRITGSLAGDDALPAD